MKPTTCSATRSPACPATLSVMRLVVRLAAILAVPVVLWACSLPVDSEVTEYNQRDLPEFLTNTTTTTTSTTTTSTTLPGATTPPTSTTTTVPGGDTAPRDIYYTIAGSDVLQAFQRELPTRVSLRGLIAELEQPAANIADFNLRTSVRVGLIASDPVLDRGTATVALDGAVFARMPPAEQLRAISQIVLTLTSFVTPDAGAIGLVRFEVDGQPFSVVMPATGGSTEPGEPVAFADFATLIASTQVPTTTTSVATTVPPSVPSSEVTATSAPA